jgi:multidrug efflux system membrane fusion protein
MKHRVLFRTIAMLALSLSLLACSQDGPEKPKEVVRPVKMLTIGESAGAVQRKFPGAVRASRRSDLSFQVSGPVLELPAQEGMEVQKGQLLARIDPRDFDRALAKIRAGLTEARAQLEAMEAGARPEDLAILQSQLNAAKSAYEESQTNLKRMKILLDKKAIAQARYDQSKKNHDAALANYRTAQENLQKGKSGARREDIEAMQARVVSLQAQRDQARDALRDTQLTAPFDGVVAKRFVEQHQFVQAKQTILSLQDLTNLEVLVDLPENLMVLLRDDEATGNQQDKVVAHAVIPSQPGQKYPLYLKEYATEADPQTQTYQVTLSMMKPEGINLLPGMTLEVVGEPPTGRGRLNRLAIPAIAVLGDNAGKSYVWVVDREAMTVSKREVQTGELTGKDHIFINSGLKLGETIVVAGVSQLREGLKVREYKLP